MRPGEPGPGDPALPWRDAMLRLDSGRMLGLARNYLGTARTPFDKRDILIRLERFLMRPETGEAALSLLDRADALILGCLMMSGGMPEAALKALFVGELPLADIGSKLAGLADRLLLYREDEEASGRIAVTPFLAEALGPTVLDAGLLFGAEPEAAGHPAGESAEHAATGNATPKGGREDADRLPLRWRALILYAYLVEHPGALRKDGSVSSRATASLHKVCPGATGPETDAIFRAFAATGLVDGTRDEGKVDLEGLERLFREHWNDLSWRLALMNAGGNPERASALARALEPFFARGFAFSRAGLARLLRIFCWREACDEDDSALARALGELGLLSVSGDRLTCRAEPVESNLPGSTTRLIVEDTGQIHLMPEADLDDRLFLISIAKPIRLEGVWTFELDGISVRRAFARGLDAESIAGRLASMGGRELPQTLAFSLDSWEEEHRRLRLFRGTFLAADASLGTLLDESGATLGLGAEKVAPGLYFLGSIPHERLEEVLASLGMETPPIARTPLAKIGRPPARGAEMPSGTKVHSFFGPAMPPSGGHFPVPYFDGDARLDDPAKRIELLRQESDALLPEGLLRADIDERIARKLVLSVEQIRKIAGIRSGSATGSSGFVHARGAGSGLPPGESGAVRKPAPPTRDFVAGAMDYQGKLRLIRQAMKSQLDRIEVQWSPPGEARRTSVLRPTGLEQNSRGHVLEAEDLGSGGPLRIGIGAMSSVRLVRASYFGETT